MSVDFANVAQRHDKIVAEEHWARKGNVDLSLFRKFAPTAMRDGGGRVLFLVHGSSASSRTAYDLDAGERGEYSVMNVFARWGYDVWTMDHEGYGRSSRTDGFSFIKDNVEDLKAATPVVEAVTGKSRVAMFGTSSGALRAGAFCNACPEQVEQLGMAAFPWTGENAPSLVKRRQRLSEWQSVNARPIDANYYKAMLTRDVAGLTIPELPDLLYRTEIANGGGTLPNGTYIDMSINLPLVDPGQITCPVLMLRSEHDGITTDEEMLGFYGALATKDKQLVTISGHTHNMTFGVNRHRFWHVLRSFLELPKKIDGTT